MTKPERLELYKIYTKKSVDADIRSRWRARKFRGTPTFIIPGPLHMKKSHPLMKQYKKNGNSWTGILVPWKIN